MPIKALRLQIVKPYNSENEGFPVNWDELGQLFRDLRYNCSKIANLVIQKRFEWENFRKEYKKQHGTYPSSKDHKDKSYLYPMVRANFPDIATSISNQVRQQAEKAWESSRSNVLRLQSSIPSFKLDFPICVHNQSYSISKTDNSYILNVGLKPSGSERTRYSVIVKVGDNSKRAILDRLIEGLYKKCALQIISDRKGKWYSIIPYEFEGQTSNELDPDKIMGVDLGIVNAAYWAFNDSLKRGKIEGKEIEVFRKRVQERRKSIQRQGKYCGEGRIGHGVKRRLQPIAILEEREANFRSTTNHRYAKKIVEEAFNYRCSVIQIEDLSGISEQNMFLKNWSYFDLQQKILDKAAERGLRVVKINPEYTSQRCSKCGHIEKRNRPNQETFVCQKCGYGALFHCFNCGTDQEEGDECQKCSSRTKRIKVNADYNAAKNIATLGIEEIIMEAISKESPT